MLSKNSGECIVTKVDCLIIILGLAVCIVVCFMHVTYLEWFPDNGKQLFNILKQIKQCNVLDAIPQWETLGFMI